MSDILRQYFDRYASNAIAEIKAATVALGFYNRIKARLNQGEDLSHELESIGDAGPEVTKKVVAETIKDYQQQIKDAWKMHDRLIQIGQFTIACEEDPRELLPRFKIDYVYKTELGDIKIKIRTAGENYNLQIATVGNPMKAQMIKTELEKQLTFIALLT
jgi:hypothetical protein